MPRNLKYLNGPTKAVRLPVALLPQIMAYVEWLDQVTADALPVEHTLDAESQNQTAAANEILSPLP